MRLRQRRQTKHFGWPFASYGIDDEIKYKDSHAKYGYVEPTLNFTPSIGISQIIKVPENYFFKKKKIVILNFVRMGLPDR